MLHSAACGRASTLATFVVIRRSRAAAEGAVAGRRASPSRPWTSLPWLRGPAPYPPECSGPSGRCRFSRVWRRPWRWRPRSSPASRPQPRAGPAGGLARRRAVCSCGVSGRRGVPARAPAREPQGALRGGSWHAAISPFDQLRITRWLLFGQTPATPWHSCALTLSCLPQLANGRKHAAHSSPGARALVPGSLALCERLASAR